MKKIQKIINQLLEISTSICNEWNNLAELSYKNQEHSNEYSKIIEKISKLLYKESVILNNASKDVLEEVLKSLYNLKRMDEAFERCYLIIDEYLESIYDENTDDEDDEIEYLDEESENQDDIEEVYPSEIANIDNTLIINNYYVDEDEIQKHHKEIYHYVAIRAIKKMLIRLQEVTVDNKTDAKYKKKLIKYFKIFKYYFFSIDRDFEKMGVNLKFNINAINEISKPNIDAGAICFNDCIDILDDLYSTDDNTRELDDISEALFNMLRFDEYIEMLDIEYINKLIEICNTFGEYMGPSFYGNISKNKLIRKRKMKN